MNVIRYHDFCMGHRILGHRGKCQHLHGHNYRVTFHVAALDNELDEFGMVADFSLVKTLLCNWLEDKFDHRTMLNKDDPLFELLRDHDSEVFTVDFNPTAENIGLYLINEICPMQLRNTNLKCVKIIIEETRKCSVEITC